MKLKDKYELLDALEEERLEQGISKHKMCQQADISHTVWTRYLSEEREPDWDYLFRVAEALGLKWHVTVGLKK
jgi:transcriptional regulator with XRE-family HTH domain